MKGLSRWLRSKQGLTSLAVVLVAVVALAATGQAVGWWELGELFGAAGVVPTNPEYPAPAGGYTCLPTCAEDDGKFLAVVGENMSSLGGIKIVTWIAVPGNAEKYQIGIFDGDSGKDNTGAINFKAGNWDNSTTETTYTLYADPLKDGSGTVVIGEWHGNQDPMPNNDWYDIELAKSESAKGPSGHYFYRFEAYRPVEGRGTNAFKLRSTGYLAAGNAIGNENSLGIMGVLYTTNDVSIVYPELESYSNPGTSTYAGDWAFSIYVPASQREFILWDGDFDRGTQIDMDNDTDDINTEGTPAWANQFALDEGAGGKGAPADDYNNPIFRREPAVIYQLIDPSGAPIYVNSDPSGTEEWEKFTMSTEAENNPDLLVDRIQSGVYILHIQGLDLSNIVWFNTQFEICDPEDGCGPPVWEAGGCALPLSYWNQNFNKLYKGKKGAAQETKESIQWGLRNTALGSPLFRSGINRTAPVTIGSTEAMTPDEAMAILQADVSELPKEERPMARALKHNLAAWLNLGTGKLHPDTPAYLDVVGGRFEGSVWEALKESENIILNGGDLKRAKELAEFITYGGTYEEKPVAPIPPTPPPYVPAPPADPTTCTARINDYTVENPSTTPLYGVRYQFAAGIPIVNGDYDEFKLVLPADVATNLESVTVAATITGIQGQGILTGCDFAGPLPCGEPIRDASNNLAFYFTGAADNADGTLTLTFAVQNFSNQPLQSITIGLPDGVVPSSPTGTYQSQVCP